MRVQVSPGPPFLGSYMANIRNKSINELTTWNQKELRKLKITINNRIEGLSNNSKPKDLPESHPLFQMSVEDCKDLLQKVIREEKSK